MSAGHKSSPSDNNTEVTDESTPLNHKKKKIITKKKKKAKTESILGLDPKWIILFLCCIVMAAMYYILAMPAGLHRQLYAIMPNENFEMNFNLLFTVSYFPNMILPMFGGVIVDKYGEARCLVSFCIIVFIGQCITTVGVTSINWKWMLIGRLIFGLGAQNLIVANASLISKWFEGNEGIALGLSNVSSYAGVIITNIMSSKLANAINPTFAFTVGVIAEAVAIGLGCIIIFLDSLKKEPELLSTLVCSPMYSPIAYQHLASIPSNVSIVASPGVVTFREPNNHHRRENTQSGLEKLRGFKPTFWLLCLSFLLIYGVVWSFTNVSSAILLERNFFLEPPTDCVPLHPDQCTSGSLAPQDGNPTININGGICPDSDDYAPVIPQSLDINIEETGLDLSSDKEEYWFESVKSADVQCQDNFWSDGCTSDYCDAQGTATEKAGFYMSIPYFFTVALTFHLGLLVDRTGWRTEMICFGSVLLVVAHTLLAYPITSPPIVPLVSQGLGYTICVAALWPSVPFTVSKDSVGFAFGIMMGVQNVGLAVMPLIVAYFYRIGNNLYLPIVEIFFAVCSLCAVIVGFALMFTDQKTDQVLATPKIDIPKVYERQEEIMIAPETRARHVRANSTDAIYMEKGSILKKPPAE